MNVTMQRTIRLMALLVLCALWIGIVGRASAAPLNTAFTYKRQLVINGQPAASGTYNLQFRLYDAATVGNLVGNPSTIVQDVRMTSGLYSGELNFGTTVFTEQARWLQIGWRPAGNTGSYTLITPRELLTLAPHAQYAQNIPLVSSGSANTAAPSDHNHFGQTWSGAAGVGLRVTNSNGMGIVGESTTLDGIHGTSSNPEATGVHGSNMAGGWGVYGNANGAKGGVRGFNAGNGPGVEGYSQGGNGVYGFSSSGYAGFFEGRTRTNVLEIAGGSDLAERFDVQGAAVIEPGTLLVIDEANAGKLKPSDRPYDVRIVGVVSGAGGINPGLTLHQEGVMEGEHIVAIAGRVYVKAEAFSGAIKPGDMLTTSPLPGHAMHAADRDQAYGAVIGKALTGLDKGAGLVLVLVNLQ